MRALVVTASLSIAAVVTSSPATSDVKVDPKPKDAAVRLEVGRQSPERSIPQPKVPGGSVPVSDEPVFDPVVGCKVDPGANTYGCRTDSPDEAPEADRPELTPGDVLRAVREIGLPSLAVKVQPGAETLVNVETIFYAEPQPFERSVDLLGYAVDVVAEPAAYLWDHGDGSSRSTTSPGRPYPAMDVVHRYTRPADDVRTRVDVTYRVRFRVDGGPWQTIPQTLVATGPATVLQVDEAAPVLTRG